MPLPLIGPLIASLGGALGAGGATGAATGAPGILGGIFGGGSSGGISGLLGSLGGGNGGGGLLGKLPSILGGILGFGKNKLAKKTFEFQKDAFNANLANQTQTYNTGLEDRIRSRHNTEGRTGAFTESYLGQHRLQDRTVGD